MRTGLDEGVQASGLPRQGNRRATKIRSEGAVKRDPQNTKDEMNQASRKGERGKERGSGGNSKLWNTGPDIRGRLGRIDRRRQHQQQRQSAAEGGELLDDPASWVTNEESEWEVARDGGLDCSYRRRAVTTRSLQRCTGRSGRYLDTLFLQRPRRRRDS